VREEDPGSASKILDKLYVMLNPFRRLVRGVLVLSTIAVPIAAQNAAGEMSEPAAVERLRQWFTENDYYPVGDDCLVVATANYINRGYALEVRARGCKAKEEVLGLWRVDSFNGAVFVKRSDKYSAPVVSLANQRPAGYRVRTEIPLRAPDRGSLQLMVDARVTPAIEEAGGAALDSPDAPSELKKFKNAQLRIVDASGRVTQIKTFGRPLAQLTPLDVASDSPQTVLLTLDYSAIMGIDNGPITSVVEIANDRWRYAGARDEVGDDDVGIVVASTGRTEWRVLAQGARQDILEVSCRPDFDRATASDMPFNRRYARYRLAGGGWRRFERVEKDACWESGDEFPANAEFPGAP